MLFVVVEGMLFSCSVTAIRLDKVDGTWAAVGWGDAMAGVVPPKLGFEIDGGAMPDN